MIEAYYGIYPESEEGTIVIFEKKSTDQNDWLDDTDEANTKIYKAMRKLGYGEYQESFFVWHEGSDIDKLVKDMAAEEIRLIHKPDLLPGHEG